MDGKRYEEKLGIDAKSAKSYLQLLGIDTKAERSYLGIDTKPMASIFN